ncbi:FmdB family zinc ribbon protein [Arthrobacter sp. Marseille-P9274]|uniref:FmdB family zinc ribbon protein n=1 Tax=Arthrobacter sp. Marseille-P9274 TaxID=2866572 RepID=UPI0021C683E6|nr:FmdB family zinc ribbon protein [Arthrobacter sp. Marseille-P9274]
MARLLFDYRCTECRADIELFVPTPAPPSMECPACAGEARRRYTSRGLALRGESLRAVAPASGGVECRDNADVPGLCHVAPAARRRLISRHRGDVETYEAETKRQTREFEAKGPPKLHQVISQSH